MGWGGIMCGVFGVSWTRAVIPVALTFGQRTIEFTEGYEQDFVAYQALDRVTGSTRATYRDLESASRRDVRVEE